MKHILLTHCVRTASGYEISWCADESTQWQSMLLRIKSLPVHLRRYDATRQIWWVHDSVIDRLSSLISNYDEMMSAAHGDKKKEEPPPRDRKENTGIPPAIAQAMALLYLTPEAPTEVITAVYRCLAKMVHPDIGGNTQQMAAINNAYEIALDWSKRRPA